MSDWGLQNGGLTETLGADTSISMGTAANSSSTVGALGTIVELGVTTFDWWGFNVQFMMDTSSAQIFGYTIYTGGSGSEQILVDDVITQSTNNSDTDAADGAHFPLFVPKGTRISVAIRDNDGSTSVGRFTIQGHSKTWTSGGGGHRGTLRAGFVSGGTMAPMVDPGSSSNTKGAYTELVDPTLGDVAGFNVYVTNNDNFSSSDYFWLVDIAVGAVGSEKVIVSNISIFSNTSADKMRPQSLGPFWVPIPKGSRVSARAQCSGTGTTDRKFGIVVRGFYT